MKCKCGENNPDNFYKGEVYRCKECSKKRRKKYYKENTDLERKRATEWRENNKEQMTEYNKKYREENKEYFKRKQQEHYNKDNAYEKNKEWRKNNREKYLKSKRESSVRYRKTLNGKINHYMSTAIWFSLKENKNRKKWQDLTGYSKEQLIERLKETMPIGFSFEDYLNGKLHIDHIIPKSVYNFSVEDDFKKCWNLRNLRLLEDKKNLVKNDFVDLVLIEELGIKDLLPIQKVVPTSYVDAEIARF